jgi:hypothetical protein
MKFKKITITITTFTVNNYTEGSCDVIQYVYQAVPGRLYYIIRKVHE